MSTTVRTDFDRLQRNALLVGAGASLLAIAGAIADPAQFYRSYLIGYLFWLGLALGSLAIVMLHHTTGGSWGFAIRRLLEAGMRTLPLMALLFVPLVVGMGKLYPWFEPSADPLLEHKRPYLNPTFFTIRAIAFFALWIGSAAVLLRLSRKSDRTGNAKHGRRARMLAGPGMAVYALAMTFAAIDWAMSLEPHWFSTMYPVIFIVGQVLSTLAFAIIGSSWLQKREPFSRFLAPGHFQDLGNLMFAFVLLWGYTSFSQFLIIWSGNLSEETPWYVHRTEPGWQAMAISLALLHFLVPFLLLLWRRIKRDTSLLPVVATLLIVMRFVDTYWLVAPSFHPAGLSVHWLDIVAPVAIGGLWLGWFVHNLKGRPLISLQDASLEGLLEQPRHG